MANCVALALCAIAGCAETVAGDPLYTADFCRRLAIVDAETGDSVVGAEDLALDLAGGRVLISAYDRRLIEREARRGAFLLSEGGVYAVPLAALKGEAETLVLPSIVARESVVGGLRPHGLSFDAARREIVFINRSYQKIDGDWRMTARLERADADGAVYIGDGGAPRCSANDVATLGERAYVSFDHAACGWRGSVEDILRAHASGVAAEDGDAVIEGVSYANGLAPTGDGGLALAATRQKQLLILEPDGGSFTVVRTIDLPGGPDNLTAAADGAIIAAVHPSLIALGLQRRFGLGRSGSRIMRVEAETGATTLLFDDPRGALFSAATAAVEADGVLVAGSVADQGLLVCRRSAD
jgi:hypothetical protein